MGCALQQGLLRLNGAQRQEMLFIFREAADGFGIALLVFGLEGGQVEQGAFPVLLFPDACQFGSDLLLLALGNGIHHIALFVNQTALTRRRWKEGGNRCEQSIMPIGDNQINLARPAST